MDKIEKFLKRLSKKDKALFLKIFSDIENLKLGGYDIKPLRGYKNMFRLRKGKIRVIFVKSKNCGILVEVAYRRDAYRA